MSSDVQAKCTNSTCPANPSMAAMRSLTKYSTAFTSWLVSPSRSRMRSASATENARQMASQARRWWPFSGATTAQDGAAARHSSHSTSTITRCRISPNSLTIGARGATRAR